MYMIFNKKKDVQFFFAVRSLSFDRRFFFLQLIESMHTNLTYGSQVNVLSAMFGQVILNDVYIYTSAICDSFASCT
jgi:hypothetical protein